MPRARGPGIYTERKVKAVISLAHKREKEKSFLLRKGNYWVTKDVLASPLPFESRPDHYDNGPVLDDKCRSGLFC